LRFDNGIDACREQFQALLLRPQHFFRKGRIGRFRKSLPRKRSTNTRVIRYPTGSPEFSARQKTKSSIGSRSFSEIMNCGSRSWTRMRHQISGTSMLMS